MMEALADFGTVATFGYRTLTEAIYRVWYGMFDRVAATQLASVLLALAAGLLVLERSRAAARASPRAAAGRAPARCCSAGPGAGATAACGGCSASRFVAARRPAPRVGARGARAGAACPGFLRASRIA